MRPRYPAEPRWLWGWVPRWFPPRRPAGSPEPFPTTVSGSPMGWESGRERRRQTPAGGLRRQAGQRAQPRAIQ